MAEIGVRARAIKNARLPVRQEVHLVVVAIVHMGQQRRMIEQADVLGETDRSARESGYAAAPHAQLIPDVAEDAGVGFKKRCLIRMLGKMRRQGQALLACDLKALPEPVRVYRVWRVWRQADVQAVVLQRLIDRLWQEFFKSVSPLR